MKTVQRAYSLFDVQSVDADQRVFKGIATTPNPDRVGDTINPLGVQFKNPLPLLHQHDHDEPVGLVEFGRPTKDGIAFTAEIPRIEEEGPLKERVDTAWGEIKYGLVRAVSIGFRPIKYAFRDDGGIDFQETEVYELSMVTIPANAEAVITAVKSMKLTPDLITQIKRFELSKKGVVQLIQPAKQEQSIPKGAVRLIRPTRSAA